MSLFFEFESVMPCTLKRSCTLHSFLGSFPPNSLYVPPSHSNSVKSLSDINLSFFVFSFLSCFALFLVSGASVPCYPTSCLISRPVVPLTFNLQTFTLLNRPECYPRARLMLRRCLSLPKHNLHLNRRFRRIRKRTLRRLHNNREVVPESRTTRENSRGSDRLG